MKKVYFVSHLEHGPNSTIVTMMELEERQARLKRLMLKQIVATQTRMLKNHVEPDKMLADIRQAPALQKTSRYHLALVEYPKINGKLRHLVFPHLETSPGNVEKQFPPGSICDAPPEDAIPLEKIFGHPLVRAQVKINFTPAELKELREKAVGQSRPPGPTAHFSDR